MTDLAGYGNLTPSTDLGKVVTMLYALLGIPLMFIYMANIGTVLASSFKFLYSKVCRCEARPDLPGSATLPAMCREDTISLRQDINWKLSLDFPTFLKWWVQGQSEVLRRAADVGVPHHQSGLSQPNKQQHEAHQLRKVLTLRYLAVLWEILELDIGWRHFISIVRTYYRGSEDQAGEVT